MVPDIHTPTSMVVAGAVAIICGSWAGAEKWPGIVNGLIGIWLLISAIWLNLAVTWNFIIFGIIVAMIAIWNVSAHPHQTPAQRPV